ncbi:hypothetical protein [Colwellia echini]|uniref:Uncharacterized protein n=1 Tax=Colwellia echini TaxID=1982103 RepID=A0ABY3MV29_9GAMM|nr:hypothetical protein [Colwellia echini]TYK65044.1 hypothetical protein CWS31_012160 [Colwellia echini]
MTTIIETNASTNEMTISQCGSSIEEVINIADFQPNFGCDDAESTLNIRQDENTFRFERMCGDEIVATNVYRKKSDDRQQYNAELNIKFDSYDELETTTQACGTVITAEVKLFDTTDTLVEQNTASTIYLATEYQGNPLLLSFLIDKLPTSGFSSLSTNIFRENYAAVSTSVLPEISDLKESHFGTLNFDFDNTMQNIQADYNFSVTSTIGHNEDIEGEFTLTFE